MTNTTEITRTVEVKEGRTWTVHHIDTDPALVYESLSHDLINKKICSASYITRIERVNMYDGTQKITITYDNNCRSIYRVKN